VPDLTEDFVERVTGLLKDRSHGVLLAGVELMVEVLRLEPVHSQAFVRLVPSLVRLLRNLLTMGYAPDHDVAGITDPFLQVKLLAMLECLGRENGETSEAMNDILAQVATNTETAKNAGNAILYQCVQTIMSIESETGLRVLAVNILGRFLLNRDNNIRYVALNTLSKVVARDAAAVQRHRNTIVDCLKDPDVSIRQRALELIYQLVTEQNVAPLVREMLNYLVVAPQEHKAAICSKVMGVVEAYAPSPRWRLDTLITMLAIAGAVADASIPHAVAHYLSTADPGLQRYAAHRLLALLREDLSQSGLVTTAAWAVGEFGDMLLQDQPALDDETQAFPAQAPGAVLDVLERACRDHTATQATRGYVLTALLKLSDRFKGAEAGRVAALVAAYETSLQPELQQRSCEFGELLRDPNAAALRPELLARIPPLNEAVLKARRARFTEAEGGSQASGSPSRRASVGKLPAGTGAAVAATGGPSKAADLLDLEDIFGGGASSAPARTPAAPPASSSSSSSVLLNGGASFDAYAGAPQATAAPPPAGAGAGAGAGGGAADLLSDIFSASSIAAPAPAMAPPAFVTDIFGGGPAPPSPALPPQQGQQQPPGMAAAVAPAPPLASPLMPSGPTVTALDKDGLRITLELSKPNPAEPQASQLLCRFANDTVAPFTGFSFQCAVPKYVTLALSPASGTAVPPASSGAPPVTQSMRVVNSLLGQKPLQLKIKVQYTSGATGQQVTELAQVSGFPDGY
jgi:AP-1 complex subunit gamma-1